MGAGGLNGELRDNPNNYIDSVLQYHLNGVRRTRSSGSYYQNSPSSFTSTVNSSFPSSSSNTTSNPTSSTGRDEDMVCYSCSVNFTILKRKKNCTGCKRDFCKECFKEGIPSLDSSVTNCLICRALKAPHVYKEYLQKIKIKDLCDFLQKKNISFQDCKEKQELIRLILQSSPAQPVAAGLARTPPTQPSTAWTSHRAGNGNGSSTTRHVVSNHSENTTNTNRTTSSQCSDSQPKPTAQNAVMRTIDDVKSVDQIKSLSVKELKRILLTNCVDFKGCCEKQELLEKVSLLWNDKKKSKDKNLDDDQEDQVCKVCMDSFIDCVLLECGHMVTCISCSKKVTECPICRQHISRIVKVFKA